MYGEEEKTIPLLDFMQRHGLETSIMQFPAVPVSESRIRLFVTSEHIGEQLEQAAQILLQAAKRFDFELKE